MDLGQLHPAAFGGEAVLFAPGRFFFRCVASGRGDSTCADPAGGKVDDGGHMFLLSRCLSRTTRRMDDNVFHRNENALAIQGHADHPASSVVQDRLRVRPGAFIKAVRAPYGDAGCRNVGAGGGVSSPHRASSAVRRAMPSRSKKRGAPSSVSSQRRESRTR